MLWVFIEIKMIFVMRCIINATSILLSPILAPEMVEGLQTQHSRKRKGLYDIAVSWNKPVLQPDNYTLQINSLQGEPRLLVAPGVSIITQ